ncbi:MAG: CPBP family intramembrane glutamic endopeptidase [Gemmataceae bacterium]
MSARSILLTIGLVFPTAITYVHFVAVRSEGPTANPRLIALYASAKLATLLLPLVTYFATPRSQRFPSQHHRADMHAQGQRMARPRNAIGLGLAFGLATGGATLGLYHYWFVNSALFDRAALQVRAKVTEFGCDTPARYIAFAAFLALAHSLLEEYYWRWFAFGALRRSWAFWPAALVASLAFMGHHVVVLSVYFPDAIWSAVVPFSLGVAIGGLVWSWLYEVSGSLVGSWLSHILVDVAIMTVGYQMLFPQA